MGAEHRVTSGGRSRVGLIAGVLMLGLAGCSDSESGSSPSEETASTTPSPSTGATSPPPRQQPKVRVEEAVESKVQRRASDFVDTTSDALAGGRVDRAALAETATGSALDGVIASATEYRRNGWHVEGTATVVRQRVVAYRPEARPPSLVLAVCLDSSAVEVLDSSGDPVPNAAPQARTWNLFTLVKKSGKWLVSEQSFPDDPDC